MKEVKSIEHYWGQQLHISDWNKTKEILMKLKTESVESVDIVSDFDHTISSHLDNLQESSPTTFGFLRHSSRLSPDYHS